MLLLVLCYSDDKRVGTLRLWIQKYFFFLLRFIGVVGIFVLKLLNLKFLLYACISQRSIPFLCTNYSSQAYLNDEKKKAILIWNYKLMQLKGCESTPFSEFRRNFEANLITKWIRAQELAFGANRAILIYKTVRRCRLHAFKIP